MKEIPTDAAEEFRNQTIVTLKQRIKEIIEAAAILVLKHKDVPKTWDLRLQKLERELKILEAKH